MCIYQGNQEIALQIKLRNNWASYNGQKIRLNDTDCSQTQEVGDYVT